jgi:hypothetical protein
LVACVDWTDGGAAQKDKEDVEEISTELELADVGDDERVP